MRKFCLVASNMGANCGQSPAYRSPISTAVTMLVFTPQVKWTFTQSYF